MLSVINRSSVIADDQHSSRVSAAAMSALVPAWLGAGRDAAALWREVVHALPEVQPHRRLALLTALMAAMPQVCVPLGGGREHMGVRLDDGHVGLSPLTGGQPFGLELTALWAPTPNDDTT